MKPCSHPLCPAMAERSVCGVHSPAKVVERMKAIVTGNFERVTGFPPAEKDILNRLRLAILRDLDSTI